MKTRFCPSPTGFMHLGNARTAFFNVLLARHQQGKFLLRVEDTDQTRSHEDFSEAIFSDLHWLGLDWHEGPHVEGPQKPYRQSERQAIYDHYYAILEQQALAYPCFCSDEQLALNRKIQRAAGKPPRYPGTCRQLNTEEIQKKRAAGLRPTLRFHVTPDDTVVFDDLVKGKQVFKTNDLGDFIIRRADGTASFMYCNAIDDSVMGVTHALRGEDHLTNTPRQLLILKALNLRAPQYGHMALILGTDGSPLSKRNGSRSIAALREAGYFPLAILNYLARLGHHLPEETWMDLSQLGAVFSVNALQKSPARFDPHQLDFWQKETVMQVSQEILWNWIVPQLTVEVPFKQRADFIAVVRPNLVFPTDAISLAESIFSLHLDYGHEAKQILKTAGIAFLEQALEIFQMVHLDFKAWSQQLSEKCQVKGKALYQPLRVALTGELHGPEMAGIIRLMGAERVKTRLEHAIFSV